MEAALVAFRSSAGAGAKVKKASKVFKLAPKGKHEKVAALDQDGQNAKLKKQMKTKPLKASSKYFA